jgi:diguanylate cyclase (GGDEF)-like protein
MSIHQVMERDERPMGSETPPEGKARKTGNGRTGNGKQTDATAEPALEAALKKLDPDDRELVRKALASAEKTEAELRYLAYHDSLTGLLDRRRFRAELDQYAAFTARYGGQGAVMILDVDGLKAVNDSFGHHAGDNLIRQIARILRERVRETDIVARLSGDELAVLMPQTDAAGALQLGEDLRAEIAEHARPTAEAESTTVSVGIAMFGGQQAARPQAVLVAADQAMYWAKEGGGNRVSIFRNPDDPQATQQRARTTTAKIRDALTHDRLSLHSQPIRSLASGGIERHELLLRMTGDHGELLPASSFIEVAERSGMVQELDRWVIEHALELLGEYERQGRPLSLHINLSGLSIADLSVMEFIERQLDEGDADPSRCTFEITGTARGADFVAAGGFADRLTELGCQVAIDDYGTEFSPFQYLKELPFDVIKIDGSFVRNLPHSDVDQLTVQAIVGVARGLGKTTIAESIQDDTTVRMLRGYGVDMGQGYHFGRPVALAEALAG